MRSVRSWAACGAWVLVSSGCGSHARDPESDVSVGRAALASALEVGPEIGTDPAVPVQANLGFDGAVASDGLRFLAAQSVNRKIRAVRVDEEGAVLDAPWLDLGEPAVSQYAPSLAFGGGQYLVAWNAFPDQGDYTVRGRLVGSNGELAGSANFDVASNALYPSVGWNGSNFLVAFSHFPDGGPAAVGVAQFDGQGQKVENSERELPTSSSPGEPHLAVASHSALVTWEQYGATGSEIHGRLLELDGSVSGDEFVLTNSGSHADLAVSADGFFAVWRTGEGAIQGRAISEAGALSDPLDFAPASAYLGPAVTFAGSSYWVAWGNGDDGSSVQGAQVSQTGVVTQTSDWASVAPNYIGSSGLAFAASGPQVLLSFPGYGVEGNLFSADATVVREHIPLTALPNAQSYPNVAWSGSNYLVTWTDERAVGIDYSVHGVRIDPSGALLDPSGIVISTAETPAFSTQLASNGQGSSLVTWSGGGGDSFARLVASDGRLGPIQPSDLALYSGTSSASNGNGYLSVFMTGDSSDGVVHAQLRDPQGQVSSSFDLDRTTANMGPAPFAAGGDYLVSYTRDGTRLIPVSAGGEVGASFELSSSLVYVNAATSGESTLVIWTESDSSIHGRFYADGAFRDEAFALSPTSAGYGAALAWSGSQYWAVWEDPENHLWSRSIAPDGTLSDVTLLLDEEAFAPVLASDGEGGLLLSYTRYLELSWTRRVVSRLLSDGTAPSTGGAGGEGGGTSAGGTGAIGAGGSVGGGAGSAGSSGGSSNAGSTGSSGASPGGTSQGGGSTGSGGSGVSLPLPRCSLGRAASPLHDRTLVLLSLAIAGFALRRRPRFKREAA